MFIWGRGDRPMALVSSMGHAKMSLTRSIQCCPDFLYVFDSTAPSVRPEGVGFGVELDSEGTTFQAGLRRKEDNPASEVR